jgi:L-aspartate oxidase
MTRYHPDGDLAPRDVVARSIARESADTGGPIFLSLAHLPGSRIRERFPTIADMCRQVGLDLATDRIPVGPAAHYLMGGIDTDEWGRTSLPGLFAAGEVACTGVHGANRLASNSLLEGLVFGARAAAAMILPPRAAPMKPDRRAASSDDVDQRAPIVSRAASSATPASALMDATAVRQLMWEAAGLFRTRQGLADASARLDAAYAADLRLVVQGTVASTSAGPTRLGAYDQPSVICADDWRRFNLVSVARLIARAALRRAESRGGHFRADFPARDDLHWKVHLTETRDSHGQ